MTRVLQPVIWSKGSLLTPQHLQMADRFFESLLSFRVEALRQHGWGFNKLEFDLEKLAGGVLAVHRASGILPDGLPFDMPTADPAPPGKPLDEYFSGDTEYLDIYLSIPLHRSGGLNLGGADTRYAPEVLLLRDENSGTTERPVQVARKNFRLLVGNESRRGCMSLRAARVKRNQAGAYELDPDVLPPLIDVHGSEFLRSLTRRWVEVLATKSSMLAGMRRQKNQSLAEFTTADIANFWLLYTINTHFPRLRHVFEHAPRHPEELFSALLSLASTLTTFSLQRQTRDLPVYDHENPGACFAELNAQLHHLIENVVPSNFVSLQLKFVRPAIYAAGLFEDRFLANTRLYLALQADVEQAELIQRVPQLVKVCSATHIEHLVRQALPGVPLVHVPQPPAAIPIKLNHVYFSLSRSGLAWEAVERARSLAAYIPAEFPEPKAELIVLLPEGATA